MCLLARRFAEAGVRFIQVTHSDNYVQWDQHGDLKRGHAKNALEVDRPIAGLLADLKSRGLLDDTLVWWGGEFGRTPVVEGTKDGRDHNPEGFTHWLAGGGVKGGLRYGATDDYGYFAVENKVHIHDLHATILHLLGLDHERLTYRYAGRDFRLTDVEGRVVSELLA
jgi:arylsulfatase A-like enzyme